MQVYQLKITIQGFHPPIWRRVLISDQDSFFALHALIQDAFEWEDYHLHSFQATRLNGKRSIIIQDAESNDEMAEPIGFTYPGRREMLFYDEHQVKLSEYLSQEHPRITYEYDFGDSWVHEIILEKVFDEGQYKVPAIVTGKRQTPPEDSRGWIHDAEAIARWSRNKKSAGWRELFEAYGDEQARYIGSASRFFIEAPFDSSDVTPGDPAERFKSYFSDK